MIQWDEFSVQTLDYDKSLLLQAAFHQARKEQNIPLRDALTGGKPDLFLDNFPPCRSAARCGLIGLALSTGCAKLQWRNGRLSLGMDGSPAAAEPNLAGSEPSVSADWQVLEGLTLTLEFPGSLAVDMRILGASHSREGLVKPNEACPAL